MKHGCATGPPPRPVTGEGTVYEGEDAAAAQLNLGVMHKKGRGVPQDYAVALKWYRLAAEQGPVEGQGNLGGLYEIGRCVPQDYAVAVKW